MKKNVTCFQGKTEERKALGSLYLASVFRIRTGFNADPDADPRILLTTCSQIKTQHITGIIYN